MKKFICLLPILAICFHLEAQVKEPDYVGEAYFLKDDNSVEKLEKNFADYKESISFKVNGKAASIFVEGGTSKTKISSPNIKLVVRAVDNNSDPLSIIRVFKFDAKKQKRTTILSVDRSDSMLASRTYSKNQIMFDGEKYGESSYLISLSDLEEGEYGIIVTNPNSHDQKRVILSCFIITK